MPHIEVDHETAQRLTDQAAARGLSPGEFVRSILTAQSPENNPPASACELDEELERLVLDLPSLPTDFSRADIYNEHD